MLKSAIVSPTTVDTYPRERRQSTSKFTFFFYFLWHFHFHIHVYYTEFAYSTKMIRIRCDRAENVVLNCGRGRLLGRGPFAPHENRYLRPGHIKTEMTTWRRASLWIKKGVLCLGRGHVFVWRGLLERASRINHARIKGRALRILLPRWFTNAF